MAENDTINSGFRPLALSIVSYEPLHHKYRPQTFKDLVGQEAIAKTLTNAIVTQRIAPAYLFTGPRGTGKTSSARILAKSLNCLASEQPTPQPCGLCEICREIARGYALDVTEIDAASNTGVDNIREIIEKTQFAPARCRYKVYIIDEVHMLSTAAFNALLKTLEEPPKRVVFVLATTDPQRVLPTIISRCQRFDFRRIPLEGMVAHLEAIASQENINITSEAITLVAQVAQGGLRDAESLLDQLSLIAGQVTVEAVWDLVGAVPEKDLMALANAIASDNSEIVLDHCRRLMDKGREPLVVLQNLAGFYRDLLIARTAPSRNDLVAVTSPTWNQLCELSQQLEASSILYAQQHLKDSEVQIKNTTQPRLWLEVTLLGLLPSANNHTAVELVTSKQEVQVDHKTSSSTTTKSTLSSQQRPNTDSSISTQSHREVTHPKANAETQGRGDEENGNLTSYFVHPSRGRDNGADSSSIATHSVSPQVSQPKGKQPSASESNPATPVAQETPVAVAAENTLPEKIINAHSATLEDIWQEVIEHLRLPAMKALLHQHCYLLSFDGVVACVGVSSQPLLKLAQSKLLSIEAAFEATYKSKVKVKLLAKTGKSSKTSSTKPPTASSQFPESESQSRVTQLVNHSSPTAAKPLPSETQERKPEIGADSIDFPGDSHVATATSQVSEPRAYVQSQKSDLGVKHFGDNSSEEPKVYNLNTETPCVANATLTPSDSLKTDSKLTEKVHSFTDASFWDTEDIEKALEDLKQFFDGEIIELADDGNQRQSLVSEQPQLPEITDVATKESRKNNLPIED